jgi:hypothetical protein
MITLSIRYTLDINKLADFEIYARALKQPIEHCGGTSVAYYLPTKIAGSTNTALALTGCGKILCSNGSLPLRYESLTVQG